MHTLCRTECMQLIDALSHFGVPQWGPALLSMTLLWLIANTLMLTHWVLMQQCHAARTLAAQLMHMHLGPHAPGKRRGSPCHTLLTAEDPSYRHMLASVLGARTFAEQARCTQLIDRLLRLYPQVRGVEVTYRAAMYNLILADAPELIESLKLRRWRGMFVDTSDDMDLVLLLLSQRTHIMALRRDETLSPTASHGL